jgi:hypothetical protein
VDMSAQARCMHAYGIVNASRVGRSLATTPRLVFPPRDGLGSTDLLICIGEMCATASPSEDEHGHGHGHQMRDSTVMAQLPS